MDDVRRDFRANQVDFIYGTIRLIEPDTESALPWARERYACVIFNLHVDHVPRSIVDARAAFTRLIDHAMALRRQLLPHVSPLRAPRPAARRATRASATFLAAKRRLDPTGVFQSDWYHHMMGQINGTIEC